MYVDAWVIMKSSPNNPNLTFHKILTDLDEVNALVTGKGNVDYCSKAFRLKIYD